MLTFFLFLFFFFFLFFSFFFPFFFLFFPFFSFFFLFFSFFFPFLKPTTNIQIHNLFFKFFNLTPSFKRWLHLILIQESDLCDPVRATSSGQHTTTTGCRHQVVWTLPRLDDDSMTPLFES